MEVLLTLIWIITHFYETAMVSSIRKLSRNFNKPLSIGGGFFYFIFNLLTFGIYGIYWLYKADEYISSIYRTQNKYYRECHPIAWYLFGSLVIIGPYIAFSAIKNRFFEINEINRESVQENIMNTVNESDTRKCPFCAKRIKKEAKICRFCGTYIPKEDKKIEDNNKTEFEIKSESFENPYIVIKDTEIRSKPDVNSIVLFYIKEKEFIDFISDAYEDVSINDVWYKVKYENHEGWCLRSCIYKYE